MTETRADYRTNVQTLLKPDANHDKMEQEQAAIPSRVFQEYLMERRRAIITELRTIESILKLEPSR